MGFGLLALITPRINMQNEKMESKVFEFWKLIGSNEKAAPIAQNMIKQM